MPAKRLVMRQVREVLRLKWACGLSDRQIAQSLRISRPTVAGYLLVPYATVAPAAARKIQNISLASHGAYSSVSASSGTR